MRITGTKEAMMQIEKQSEFYLPHDQRRGIYRAPIDCGANWRRASRASLIKRTMIWWYGISLYLMTVIVVTAAMCDAGHVPVAFVVAFGLTASAFLVGRRYLRNIRKDFWRGMDAK